MEKNLETYTSKTVVDWYSRMHDLFPAEKVVLEQHAGLISKSDLLDIGIGGGRTTAFLMNRCGSYTGIDYSQEFTALAKNRYPGLTILTMDARDLSAFANNSFDFVNFSFNGIDYMGMEGRLKIISEIHRVLKPGGLFFFSTHNRHHSSFDEWPWKNKNISTLVKIKTFIKLIPFISRKLCNKKLELVSADHAIINNAAHSYGLMTFYTSPSLLRNQLGKQGFEKIELYNRSGKCVEDTRLDDYMFVTARKNA